MMCLARWLINWAKRRVPDFVIGGNLEPYLLRWYFIPRNPIFNIYIHNIRRSDDDRALHDHPWVNCSVILSGSYVEVMPLWQRQSPSLDTTSVCIAHRKPGSVTFRWPSHRHRIKVQKPCWSLFITGPVVREWGFHCPKGWVRWQHFTDSRDSGQIGRGCK